MQHGWTNNAHKTFTGKFHEKRDQTVEGRMTSKQILQKQNAETGLLV
jgi:hypothetical protein